MSDYTPYPQSRAVLGNVVSLLRQSSQIPHNFGHHVRYFTVLPGGQLYFDSELELDTDGASISVGDPTHRPGTSLSYSSGQPLNANAVPFYVLPGPPGWTAQFGIKLGDYAAVVYRDKFAVAVFGDRGPKSKLGEGSLQLFRALGEERVRNGRIVDAGMGNVDAGRGVITIVFPGSGSSQRFSDQAALMKHMEATAGPLWTALKGAALPAPALVASEPSLAVRIVEAAKSEIEAFGGCLEGSPPLRARIGEYWSALGFKDRDGASYYAWSAAFINWIVRQARAGKTFTYNGQHSVYVNAAIKDHEQMATGRFWGYRPDDLQIARGDILAMNRSTGPALSYEYASKNNDFPSHCDIVVDVAADGIRTIGGNVGRAPGEIGRKRFQWDAGVLRNVQSPRQQVYAVLRPPPLG